MATSVDICNEALTMIGENVITTIDDDTKPGRLCKLKYANKRDYLLRRYQWKFATKRAELDTPDGTAPVYEFSARFAFPADCIQFREIYPDTVVYNIESNFILCSESSIFIKYTYQVTDVDEMDSTFKEALSTLLARELAIPLADSDSKHAKMDELFEVKLSEARFAGSIEDDIEAVQADNWLNERN